MSTYEAALDGRVIGTGTLQEVRAAFAEAATGLLAQDPMGASPGAQEANQAFGNGRLNEAIAQDGFYRAVRAFGRGLEKQQLVDADPMAGLDLPKLDEKVLRPLTVEEEQHMLDAFNDNSPSGCRTKAILMLMLDVGLRRSEVISLKHDDLNLEDGFLLIQGKGRKERWIPFGYKTGSILQRYAMLHRPDPANPTVDTFFLDSEGYPMTVNALKMVFERVKAKTGIARLHPHLLRHTFGIRSQEMNMPSLILQRYMGHSDVRTTERYAHAAQSEKIKRERHYSHVDQLNVRVKKAPRGSAIKRQ